MTQSEWALVLALFEAARELPLADQPAWLNSSGAPPHVVAEVLALLEGLLAEEADPDQPAPGKVYGRYTITARLGRGGMGEVFSALDAELKRPVAMKFIRSGIVSDHSVELLVREARAASALNHPNIITVHDVLRSETAVAIITELVEGQPLRAFCGMPQQPSQVAAWGAQAARGLAAAHARNVVHGDVKPENIMVRADGQIKLLDFGLARHLGPGEPDPALAIGSPHYMSPGQITGLPPSPASDVFSLGLVLWELASGSRPSASGPASKIHPAALAAVLTAMLDPDPDRRLTAALAADRLALLEHPSTGQRLRALWAVAILAIAAAFVAIFWKAASPRPFTTSEVTNFTGVAAEPTLSPDGLQVAFTWSGLDDRRNVYVKDTLGEGLRRFTDSAKDDWSPAWSPDGKWIAWLRRSPDGGDEDVLVKPASGGAERVVGRVVDHQGYRGLAWWPDSQSLIVRDALRDGRPLVRLSLNGSKTPLSVALENQDSRPAVSPNGHLLAFTRAQPGKLLLCTLALMEGGLTGGQPKCRDLDPDYTSIAWLGDSSHLLVSSHNGIDLLSDSGSLKTLLTGDVSDVVADPHSGRVLFARTMQDINIWRFDVPSGKPSRFIASNREDSEPEYSPTGDRIVFRSDRSGSEQIYTCDASGEQLRQLTDVRARDLGSARWSPDGRWIVFDGTLEEGKPPKYTASVNVYIVSADAGPQGGQQGGPQGGQPRRLTDDTSGSIVPAWSHDGQWVYYTKEPGGRRETWKVSRDGGKPILVSASEAFDMTESEDGQWLYFTRQREKKSGIWRRRVSGGEAEPVPGTESLVYRSWNLRGENLYFRRAGPRAGFVALDLRTMAVKTLGGGPNITFNGPRNVTASPDGRTILYSQLDVVSGDIYRFELPGFNAPAASAPQR